jgi:hypothetical protein
MDNSKFTQEKYPQSSKKIESFPTLSASDFFIAGFINGHSDDHPKPNQMAILSDKNSHSTE